MTVIINDFEIMVEPPGQQADKQADASQSDEITQKPTALKPQDIERIMRHFEERRERVAAD